MTVFVAYAPANHDIADALEKHLERRGQFVELDDGQTAMRPVMQNDVLVLLVSKDLVFSPTRLRLEQRALDAWANGRLVVVKIDHGIAPVGLRDLPAIDASFEAQREFKWNEVADAVRNQLLRRPDVTDLGRASDVTQGSYPDLPARKSRGGFGWVVWGLLALPGLVAIAAAASIWLVNRIGPTPGGLPELREGIDQFGARFGMPGGVTEWLFVAAIALTLFVIGAGVARLFSRPPKRAAREDDAAAAEEPASAPPPQSEEVFVSYARANAPAVMPVLDGLKQLGKRFWLDQQGIGAGESWAGEIVRAIRAAPGVVVMCSKAAFESDHVKREIYLADRYRKKLVPVFIEQADPPEDFEYFFAGVQMLNLFETPEADRPQALMRALGGAA